MLCASLCFPSEQMNCYAIVAILELDNPLNHLSDFSPVRVMLTCFHHLLLTWLGHTLSLRGLQVRKFALYMYVWCK